MSRLSLSSLSRDPCGGQIQARFRLPVFSLKASSSRGPGSGNVAVPGPSSRDFLVPPRDVCAPSAPLSLVRWILSEGVLALVAGPAFSRFSKFFEHMSPQGPERSSSIQQMFLRGHGIQDDRETLCRAMLKIRGDDRPPSGESPGTEGRSGRGQWRRGEGAALPRGGSGKASWGRQCFS